jgi:hypothetical protein
MSKDEELGIYRQLFIAKLLNQKGHPNLSLEFLKKIEKKHLKKITLTYLN